MTSSVPPRLAAALEDRYRIERPIGQGGMAMVFLAHDERHDRQVALKVLRPELAAVIGAARFLAEIKTTANLQHPHILPLFDSGEVDGTVFYVMPYVEGESLRDRLTRDKQLPVDEAVRLAREVASALDYAHRRGIVHRDIKPENILLHEGQAMIADFGISLAVSRSEGGSRMTETGMSLGTPHYMAPEQAMGEREVTARADIYALGCVLYEMLTGDPPFVGSTAQAVVARAITESPRAIRIQRHTVPVHVEATVLQALEKLPSDRFSTAAEFSEALKDPSRTEAIRAITALAPGTAASSWRARAALPLGLVALAALSVVAWLTLRPRKELPIARYAIEFTDQAAPLDDRPIALSRDGRYFAYIGRGEGGARQLWVKARDEQNPRPLPETLGVLEFAFSPDGNWIAFTQVRGFTSLKKISLDGGAPVQLADSVVGSLVWLTDNRIVIAKPGYREISAISSVDVTRERLWSDSVQMAPFAEVIGSTGLLMRRCRGDCSEGTDLAVLDQKTGEVKTLAPSVVGATYLTTGHVLFVGSDGGMMVQRFDARELELRDAPIPVMDSVAIGGAAIFAASQTGLLIARLGGVTRSIARYEFVWVNRSGVETSIDSSLAWRIPAFGANAGWALSPDGTKLAFGQNTTSGDNLWVKDLRTGPVSRVTFDSFPSYRPRWSRDGRSLYYSSRRDGNNSKLFKRAADGTSTETLILAMPEGPGIFEAAWSVDEATLVFRAGGTVSVVGGRDLLIIRPGVDSAPRPLVASTQFDEAAAALSPDGKWLLHESNEGDRIEVYLRPFPNVDGGRWQISVEGGRAPLWARNGREIFFVDGKRRMVSVAFTGSSVPAFGPASPLFTLRPEIYLAANENYTPFDIAPNGGRFIMARRINDGPRRTAPLVVTENWSTELRRLTAPR